VFQVTKDATRDRYLLERSDPPEELRMAMFNGQRAGDRESIGTIGQASHLSILAQGTKIVGEIECAGIVKIEGQLEGVVRGREQVLVAPGGVVIGNVVGAEVVIAGRVDGDVAAGERLELRPGGVIHGDVTAPRVIVQEGGELNGRVKMEKPASRTTVARTEALKKTA
jgi:cytoskeletal protein CcmA (bactofilin family)